jgi:hypothetical protein
LYPPSLGRSHRDRCAVVVEVNFKMRFGERLCPMTPPPQRSETIYADGVERENMEGRKNRCFDRLLELTDDSLCAGAQGFRQLQA